MTADQFLSLADALHSYARHSGRDLNESHLFVHAMLMRAIKHEPIDDEDAMPPPTEQRISALDARA
ncbi:MAG: hypothetical protein AB7O98_08200 [Hyphomonadaceae bacterium]